MPILKSFLKDGEAESYRNVQVKFVHGRKAIMTIYESGDEEGGEESWVEKEQIVLSDYETKVRVALCMLYIIHLCTNSHLLMKLLRYHATLLITAGGNACING